MSDDPVEQILAHTWRPTLSVVGADGLLPTNRAGNVLRPSTSLQLSFRLPRPATPTPLDAIARVLTASAPRRTGDLAGREAGPGWNAPTFAPWLESSLERASQAVLGAPARAFGEGGTIPFMGMLGQRFPDAQFVITGVLGPDSNAHGPNEYLHLPTAERLTAAPWWC